MDYSDEFLKNKFRCLYKENPEWVKSELSRLEATDNVNAIDPNNPKATYGLWLNERNAYIARKVIRLLKEIIEEDKPNE